jgi:cytochrome P450
MTEQLLTIPPLAQDGGHALFAWLREMRDQRPVWRDRNEFWNVFRYADVYRAAADPAVFSSNASSVNPSMRRLQRGMLTRVDPPEHHKLRRLISQSFTPKRVAGLAPRIAQVATELLDEAAGSHQLDLVRQFAYPLPVIVIAELLGMPIADRNLFRRWADGLWSIPRTNAGSESFASTFEDAIREMDTYLLGQCLARRRNPGDDLISDLVNAEVEGERLDDEQVVNLSRLLLLAGHITTTLLIGNTVLCLHECPEAAAELRGERSLIPAALEEVLRFRSPFPRMARFTTRHAELSGQVIPANQVMMLWLLSANHDERQFTDPERFDIHRYPNEQAAFGHGVHFCLGAPLARLEGKIAVDLLLTRFVDIEITPGTDLSTTTMSSGRSHYPSRSVGRESWCPLVATRQ